MTVWRLLDTGALPAALNMAIDEALLHLHVPGQSPPTLRFYQWSPPAVSLGYFQKRHTIDLPACRELGLDVVRRITGGRAVLHQDDLTYSVIGDSNQGLPSSLHAAYRLLCKGLLAGFRRLGFEAELGQEQTRAPHGDICFVRAAIGDLVYHGRKFVGSAQTWYGASLLQHGSIMLEPQTRTWQLIIKKDRAEPISEKTASRMISLREVLGRRIDFGELKQALKAGMAEALQVEFQSRELTPREWAVANELAAGKRVDEGIHNYDQELSATLA
jgi:lipoyl(octanoyl) transferase